MSVSSPLTPAQRTLRARAAAYALHSLVDSREHMKPAQAAGPGAIGYWLTKVDPDQVLAEPERTRRAEAARKAHFTKLALASSRARSRRAGS